MEPQRGIVQDSRVYHRQTGTNDLTLRINVRFLACGSQLVKTSSASSPKNLTDGVMFYKPDNWHHRSTCRELKYLRVLVVFHIHPVSGIYLTST
jgi:hypothetical protein